MCQETYGKKLTFKKNWIACHNIKVINKNILLPRSTTFHQATHHPWMQTCLTDAHDSSVLTIHQRAALSRPQQLHQSKAKDEAQPYILYYQ